MPMSGATSRTSSSTSSDKPLQNLGEFLALVFLKEVPCIPYGRVALVLCAGHGFLPWQLATACYWIPVAERCQEWLVPFCEFFPRNAVCVAGGVVGFGGHEHRERPRAGFVPG